MTSTAKGQELLDFLVQNAVAAEPHHDGESVYDTVPVLSNFELIEANGKPNRKGLLMQEIRSDLNELTGGWPKRVGEVLFVEGANCQPIYLDSPTKLFAWLDTNALVDWHRGSDCVSQERFYAGLVLSAEAYDAVETVPSFPPTPRTYYMHPPLPSTDGSFLEQFVNYFTPYTTADRELIKAFVLTTCWGGPPGKRPAFLISGPDNDPQPRKKGRGVGKSTLVSLLSILVGGMVMFSPRDDIDRIKTRLLSSQARSRRIALLDNLKTLRFSWADLEGLITAPIISGQAMQ